VRRETIASRLYLIGGLALLSVTALSAGAIHFAAGTSREADALHDGGIVRILAAGELELLLETHRRMISAAPSVRGPEQLEQARHRARDVQARIATLVEEADDALAASAGPELRRLWQSGDEVMRLAERAEPEAALAGVAAHAVVAGKVQDLVRQHRLRQVALAEREARAMLERTWTLVDWVIGTAVLASLLIGPLGFTLLRRTLARLGRTSPETERRIRARRQLENELSEAVAGGQLELFYQPIVSLASRRVTGCEALLRWRHPARGMVSPEVFVPVAEETGLIREIGAWTLAEACATAAAWPGDLSISVNLSVAQVSEPDLIGIAVAALDASGLPARRLVLEVTESLLLEDDPAAYEVLHRLRGLGVAVALDDFGAGCSSLSYLRSFPFDRIKIDQSFVRDLPQRRNCEAIVRAVAHLASALGMTTVAEGVETEDHLACVAAAGCDAVQGYLFSRPVPAADIGRVIAEIDRRLAGEGARAA
jgi:EAL domain-containing protein (putative c-di-GMP-specific phosphodiesterase class I)